MILPFSPSVDSERQHLMSQDSIDLRKRCGLPHPLAQFGIAGKFIDGPYADYLAETIHMTVLCERDSLDYKAARWLLLESERAFEFACRKAGIDRVRLRRHLRRTLGEC